jgi:hypothetical protein
MDTWDFTGILMGSYVFFRTMEIHGSFRWEGGLLMDGIGQNRISYGIQNGDGNVMLLLGQMGRECSRLWIYREYQGYDQPI